MEVKKILERIELGEDSTAQFKENITNNASLAEEMVAFSNSIGGMIFVGVRDNGEISGLSSEDIRRINNMVSNVASDHVRPPITPLTRTVTVEGKVLLLIDVKVGINKPYCTNNGVYVTKSGADKRRISQEEQQRLFQEAQKIYADELIVYNSSIDDIDEKLLSRYYEKEYGQGMADEDLPPQRIMENLCLTKNDKLTLAGLLLFGKQPQLRRPACMVKAISFVGNEISGTLYRDSEDIKGNIAEVFKDSTGFFMRNLHKLQNDKPFNSVGDPEIPKIRLAERFKVTITRATVDGSN